MNPKDEYSARLSARLQAVARLEQRDRIIANARAAVFLIGVAVAWLAFRQGGPSGWWVALPAALFLALVAIHDRALTARRRVERSVAFYQRGLARLDGKWAGHGERGERFVDLGHPYARDLDLFGSGSLFELVCTARTSAGEAALAAWLSAPASPSEIRRRQAAVRELTARIDLREELAIVGEVLRSEVAHPEDLSAWGERPALFDKGAGWLRALALALAAVAVATLVEWLNGALPATVFVLAGAAELGLYRLLRDRLERVMGAIAKAQRDLAVLAQVSLRLEREPFESPLARELQARLATDGAPASQRIAELARLADLLLAMQNQFFLPLGLLLLWPVQLAIAVEGWRARHGRAIAGWLAAAGDLEALTALAGYAYEHPADPFPEIADDGAQLDGEALGHPLLPDTSCVRNDVRLGAAPRVLLVSGSNMSGKSTLLRTVGTNVVLALAGAPVRAARLVVSPLAVGATLRIQDSLQEGSSRFYAEITRLRQLVDLAAGAPPLLFLLDEILHGTNSHDRRIGAEGVVRGLLERGAIGLITTHDLALAEMANGLGSVARNVHFEDHLENGKLTFDYKMREGVVQKSNALELMRAVGLRV